MRFSVLQSAAAGLALCAGALADYTAPELVSSIQALTGKCNALQAPANSVTVVNGPLILSKQGPYPQIISGLQDIVQVATSSYGGIGNVAPYLPGAESDSIYDAFHEFVEAHQSLLAILIAKAGLFQNMPAISSPVVEVLRSLENVLENTIVANLITRVQSRAADFQGLASGLDVTMGNAIQAYQGLAAM
jgi:hypothetical protein